MKDGEKIKAATLCSRCAAVLAQGYIVKRVAGGVDNKVTCEQCGKRRYGGEFEIWRKGRRNGP